MTKRTSRSAPTDEEILLDRLREGFGALRLPKVRERLDELLAAPEAGMSRLEWLWSLIGPQVATRVESRIERRIRESRLPDRKTLAAFDFDFQKGLDRDLVLELDTLAFLQEGWNILLAGWSGTGKSHIAKALGLSACIADRRVRYTTSEAMLSTLNGSLADKTLEKAVKQYTRPDLLVIDEVGLDHVERKIASKSGLMQKVLIPRYIAHQSTIITSNIDWKDWGDYLEDPVGAAAILDRLVHRSHVIVIEGPSFREHEHKKNTRQSAARRKKERKPANG